MISLVDIPRQGLIYKFQRSLSWKAVHRFGSSFQAIHRAVGQRGSVFSAFLLAPFFTFDVFECFEDQKLEAEYEQALDPIWQYFVFWIWMI